MLPNNAVLPLVFFMALILATALHGLAASGHFPREHRAPALASGTGPAVLFGSIALVIAALVLAIEIAAQLLPWYAAVIGAGLSMLSAPLILRQFPDRFVDGRSALIAFGALALALAALMFWTATA